MKRILTGSACAVALALTTFTAFSSTAAQAADLDAVAPIDWAGSFMVRGRVLGVITEDGQKLTPRLNTTVTDSVVPEVDFSYFLTDNIAFETIAGVTYHTLKLKGGANIGKAWIVPATLTAQYHFHLGSHFKPYIGAGPHMALVMSDKAKGPFTSFKLKNPRFGVALQAGMDYMIDDHWSFNLDVKKVFVSLKANVNRGAVTGKAKINPWIIGTGIGYKF
ncbi:MAG TPA: OmpW family protein [Gammaproteobacteria bacterium]|nr:OmpW family protein [Gammaproteobacteria bacterium]